MSPSANVWKCLVCWWRGHVREYVHNKPIDDGGYSGHVPWWCARCGVGCCEASDV